MQKLNFSKSNLIFYFFHPVMLAFYFWLITLYFTPNYFQKYNAKILDTEHRGNFDKVFYRDLNSDSISERVSVGYNGRGKEIRIQHYNINNEIYDQWMPRGRWLTYFKPVFGDYNNNGFDEIYCLSIDKDSIFLSIKELMLEGGLEIKDRYICNAGTFENGQNDIIDCGGRLMNLNRDTIEEYIFNIHSGFSKFPRNTFAYYITKDSLVMSPLSASGMNNIFDFMDMNGDDVCEITGMIGSPENIHYQMPYTDSAAWLMVIDPVTMNFQFPPIRFNVGIGSFVNPVFYKVNGKKYIAASIYSNSAKLALGYLELKLFNKDGKLLNESSVKKSLIKSLYFFKPPMVSENNFYLIDNIGNIYKTDTSLSISPFFEPDSKDQFVHNAIINFLDVDGDGKKEMLLLGGNRKAKTYLRIYNQNLKGVLSLELPESKHVTEHHFNLIEDGTKSSPILMCQADNFIYMIKYRKNPYFILKYPTYIVVYLLLFLAFWLLQRIQTQYAKQKYEEEKRLTKQQMALSKKQLEPHFMLNTLNNIGYMFSKENNDDAQYYFGRFASLIHRGLEYADKTEISLFEELEFIRDYLILQQKRFDDDFSFTIESDDIIDLHAIQIPHSLIYTFVENAVKHGLRPKIGDKKLEVIISKKNQRPTIRITDNGVGRKQSNILKTSGTGKGLGIVAGIIDGYNKLNNRGIAYDVEDLIDEDGKGIGTTVIIVV